MAGQEKTERPTPKRKKEARKEGKVARSPEISGWAGVLLSSFLLPMVFRQGATRVENLLLLASESAARPRAADTTRLLGAGLYDVVVLVAPIALAYLALALALGFAQVGVRPSLKPITPTLSRLNPVEGLRRLISPNGLWELAKAVVKLAVISLVAWSTLSSTVVSLIGGSVLPLSASVVTGASSTLSLLHAVAGVGLVIALADYGFQRWRMQKSLRMSRQEIKDETRQSEGDPLVRRRIRSQQVRMTRLRMMAAVASADVVVVNPTHFAVALRYERGQGSAPRVVAKGADELAARIREEADRHAVPVVSDPPLARSIYSLCEIDSEIPAVLYSAVARLLAFVYGLSPAARRFGGVLRVPGARLSGAGAF